MYLPISIQLHSRAKREFHPTFPPGHGPESQPTLVSGGRVRRRRQAARRCACSNGGTGRSTFPGSAAVLELFKEKKIQKKLKKLKTKEREYGGPSAALK
jgi:hypothetical protein